MHKPFKHKRNAQLLSQRSFKLYKDVQGLVVKRKRQGVQLPTRHGKDRRTLSCWTRAGGGGRGTAPCTPRRRKGTLCRRPGFIAEEAWPDQKMAAGREVEERKWGCAGDGDSTTAAATLASATTGRSRRTNPTASCRKSTSCFVTIKSERFLVFC